MTVEFVSERGFVCSLHTEVPSPKPSSTSKAELLNLSTATSWMNAAFFNFCKFWLRSPVCRSSVGHFPNCLQLRALHTLLRAPEESLHGVIIYRFRMLSIKLHTKLFTPAGDCSADTELICWVRRSIKRSGSKASAVEAVWSPCSSSSSRFHGTAEKTLLDTGCPESSNCSLHQVGCGLPLSLSFRAVSFHLQVERNSSAPAKISSR